MNIDMTDLIGCMCEIKTMDNELLTLGKISAYFPEDHAIEIVPCEGDEMPSALYSTKVRVNVCGGNRGFVGLDGFVYIAHGSFWRLYDVCCFGENERRSYFRIKIRSKAEAEEMIEREPAEEPQQDTREVQAEKYPCIVTSVSISGLLIAVDDEACHYHVGTKLLISGFAIEEMGPRFSLKCCVKRTDYHKRLGKLFGCEFTDSEEKETDRLCQAIFAQQRIEIQRKRGLC